MLIQNDRCYLPDEASLLEVELQLLCRVQIVQDYEAARRLVVGNISEVDALSGEGSHGTVVIEVGAADGQIFVELDLLGLLLHQVVASPTKTQRVGLNRGTFDIADLDGQVKCVFLSLEGSEKREDVADFVGAERALGVLNLENAEIVVILVKFLHATHIDLVLQLGDTKVLDLNRVGDGPLETDRYRWQVIRVLDELELGTAVQSLTFEANRKRLSVENLEEDAQVVLTNFLGVVEHVKIHLLARSQ